MRIKKKLSIYQKIVIVMLITGLLPIFTALFVVRSRTTKMITDQAIVSLKALQRTKAIDIENNVNGLIEKAVGSATLNMILRAEKQLSDYHKKMNVSGKAPFPINTPEYKKIYNSIDQELRDFAKEMGFEELFIICAPHGHVMFSLDKKDDLGTNLGYGKYKNTGLAKLWKKVVKTGKVTIVDFEPYPPLNNKQTAFV